MELVIFPVSARQFGIKDMLDGHAGVEDFLGGIVWEVTRRLKLKEIDGRAPPGVEPAA